MADDTGEPEISIQVAEVLPATKEFEAALELAARVLAQDRYLTPPAYSTFTGRGSSQRP